LSVAALAAVEEVAAAAASVELGLEVEVVEAEEEDEVDDEEVEEEVEDVVVEEDDDDVDEEDVVGVLVELVKVLLDSLLVGAAVVVVSEMDMLTVASWAVTPLAVFATVAAWSLAVPHPHCEKPPSKLFL